MGFSFLKNPFEKLSADNQQAMVDEMKLLNEAVYGSEGVLNMLDNISMHTKWMYEELVKIGVTLEKNGNAGAVANTLNQKELDKMGDASMALGGGMEKIVGAIKTFSKIPADTVDLFVEGMEKLGEAFEKIGEGVKAIETAGKALLNMAKGIFFFGLALLLSGPIYLLALPLAPIVIGVVIGVLWLFTKFLGDKESMEGIEAGGKALMWMAGGILLFGIALLLSGPIYQKAMSWSLLLVVGVIVGAFILMSLLDRFSDTIIDGIQALMWMGVAILVFGIALVLAVPIYEYLWAESKDGLLVVGLVVLAAVAMMLLLSKAGDNVLDGAKGMVWMAISILVLGVALWAFGKLFPANEQNWDNLLLIGAAVLGLVIALRIVAAAGNNVMKGAFSLGIASAAIIVLGLGLMVWMEAKVTLPQLIMLSAAVAGLTLVLTILGGMSIMVIAGAGALIMAAGAVTLLAYGMEIWMKAKVTTKDAVVMTAMIVALGLVATVLGNPFTSWMALIGAGVMIMVGVALVEMSIAMKNFKDAGATVKAAETIVDIVGALAGGFAQATTKGGKDWDWWDVRMGIFAMQGLGKTLTGIAEGVQAFANLYISEYEYDEKTGEMKEVARVKLTKTDFDNVAYGMQAIIGAIAGPLAEVGKADAGSGTGFWASVFGGSGYVRKGIRALQGVGKVLSGLAKGVQDFANLTVSEYSMVEDSQGVLSLQETSRRSLGTKDFNNAKASMKDIVGWAAEEFGAIGKAADGQTGGGLWGAIFGKGYIQKGIEALTGVGDVLSGLAKGVQDFANMTFTTYIVKDIDGVPTIVPDTVTTIADRDITTATGNIGKVITAVAKPFGMIGQGFWSKLLSGGETFPYSSDDIKRGVESLTGIGDVITGLAKGIQSFARMEFIENEVKTVNGIPTLVPKKVHKMSKNDIKMASSNINLVLMTQTRAVGLWADEYVLNKGKKKKIEDAFKLVGTISSKLGKVAEAAVKLKEGFDKVGKMDKFNTNVSGFLAALSDPFNTTLNPSAKQMGDEFEKFARNVTVLGRSAKDMEKIDTSFKSISSSMGTFKDNVNSLDITLLKETRGLFEAMAVIADAGSADDIMAKYGATLKDTFENLASLLEEFGGKVADGAEKQAGAAVAQTKSNESLGKTLDKQQKRAEAQPPAAAAASGNMGAQLDEIAGILRGTLKVRGGSF